jgi:hypothetical protein
MTVQGFLGYGVPILLQAFAVIVNLAVARLRAALSLNAGLIESGWGVYIMGLEKMRVVLDTIMPSGVS